MIRFQEVTFLESELTLKNVEDVYGARVERIKELLHVAESQYQEVKVSKSFWF